MGIIELGKLIQPRLLLGFSLSSRDNFELTLCNGKKRLGNTLAPKGFQGEKRYPTNSLILKGFSSNNSIQTSVSENICLRKHLPPKTSKCVSNSSPWGAQSPVSETQIFRVLPAPVEEAGEQGSPGLPRAQRGQQSRLLAAVSSPAACDPSAHPQCPPSPPQHL